MQDKDDQQWLDALAGRSDASADPTSTAQAKALRTAMVARRAAIEHATQHADPEEFERLRSRLQSEGLLYDSHAKQQTRGWLQAARDVWLPVVGGAVPVPRWGVAATLILGVALALQVVLPGHMEADDVLRGGTAVVLTVSDPEARLAELTTGINKAKGSYTVTRFSSGVISIAVKADNPVLGYLQTQRITPTVKNDMVVVTIRLVVPENSKP